MSGHDDCDDFDKALSQWRQGDCVVGEQWFLHRFSPARPLTPDAVSAAAEGVNIVETPEAGRVAH